VRGIPSSALDGKMVIISDRRAASFDGTRPVLRVSPAPSPPGDRRSPLTPRPGVRSGRAQSTQPTRSFAFRRSEDNSGLAAALVSLSCSLDNAHGRAARASRKARPVLVHGRINGPLYALFFGLPDSTPPCIHRPVDSPGLSVEPSHPLLHGYRPTDRRQVRTAVDGTSGVTSVAALVVNGFLGSCPPWPHLITDDGLQEKREH